jgi:hypothetical protein
MANERQKNWMQEALDEALPPDKLDELRARLEASPEDAAQYERLRRIDRLLRSAPLERAPAALAVGIMARLAETLSQRAGRRSGAALALTLAVLAALLLPLLVAFGWLILNSIGSPAALGRAFSGLNALLTGVLAAVEGLIASAQRFVEAYPEAPAAALAIIPLSLAWLVRTARKHRTTEKQRRAETRLADTTAPIEKPAAQTAEARDAARRLAGRAAGEEGE